MLHASADVAPSQHVEIAGTPCHLWSVIGTAPGLLDGPAIGHSRRGRGLPNQRISRARLSSSALSSCFVMFLILRCAYQTIRETRVCFMGHQTSTSIIKPQSAPKSEAIAQLPATKPTCRCEAFCGPTPRPTERDARRIWGPA